MKTSTEAIDFMYRLISAFPQGIVVFNVEGYVTLLNDEALVASGKEGHLSEFLEQPIFNLFSEGAIYEKISSCLHQGRKDFVIDLHKIGDRYYKIVGQKILDGMMILIQDETSNVISQFNATKLLLKGQEIERARLSKEIHDGIGPFLSSLKLKVELLDRKSEDLNFKNSMKEISKELSDVASDIRKISHDLSPTTIKDFGLIAGIETLISRLNLNDSIEVSLDNKLDQKELSFSYELGLNIYRIIQEAINNAIKHASCSKIDVCLKEKASYFNVQIKDDGNGFGEEKNSKGIGLKNIETRAQSILGSVKFRSKEGEGLTVDLLVPKN